METLQDVRNAYQMWEYEFKYAGREPITLSSGKSGGLTGLVSRIARIASAKLALNNATAKMHGATA
jgi:hypothetical protein